MATAQRYQYVDLKPARGSFLSDVLTGLSAQQKHLPPKYFYDARGSELFEAICGLPEYYPTRTERAMLSAAAPQIALRIGSRSAIVEYGTGSGTKTPILIDAVRPAAYVAIDISGEQLRSAVESLAGRFPDVRVVGVCADYTRAIQLSEIIPGADVKRRVVFFPGSTIGNFTPDEARGFLINARCAAGHSGAMLVGVDLKKDREVVTAAYNDAQGVTAAFNLNLLERINRELGADFDPAGFAHRAHYDESVGRIEMHLASKREQQVRLDGHTFRFRAGETIHTENSYKYSVDDFQTLARDAGFIAEYYWIDPQRLFSLHYLTVADAAAPKASTARREPE